MEEPKEPMQEDQPKDDDNHNSDDYSDDESDYSLLTDDDDDQEDELMIEAKSKTHPDPRVHPKNSVVLIIRKCGITSRPKKGLVLNRPKISPK